MRRTILNTSSWGKIKIDEKSKVGMKEQVPIVSYFLQNLEVFAKWSKYLSNCITAREISFFQYCIGIIKKKSIRFQTINEEKNNTGNLVLIMIYIKMFLTGIDETMWENPTK